jgi:hypothetical protein
MQAVGYVMTGLGPGTDVSFAGFPFRKEVMKIVNTINTKFSYITG